MRVLLSGLYWNIGLESKESYIRGRKRLRRGLINGHLDPSKTIVKAPRNDEIL